MAQQGHGFFPISLGLKIPSYQDNDHTCYLKNQTARNVGCDQKTDTVPPQSHYLPGTEGSFLKEQQD